MRLHPKVETALAETGLPWSVERGKKHLKVIVGGRFTTILPSAGGRKGDVDRATANSVAQIRRVARELMR